MSFVEIDLNYLMKKKIIINKIIKTLKCKRDNFKKISRRINITNS